MTPKLKSKPTPAQARILRAMIETPNVFVAFNERGADYQGHGAWRLRMDEGKPRRTSVQKMIDQGWLRPYEHNRWLYEVSEAGRKEFERLTPFEFVSKARTGWSSEMILSALRNRYKAPEWLWCEELHLEGYKTRRIDAFALRLHSGRDRDLTKYLTRIAFEVKVDRADFLNELKNPEKRRLAMNLSNYFLFAAPAGMIAKDEVPKDCGLIEIHSMNRTIIRPKPPYRRGDPPDWLLVATIARAMMKE